MRTKSVAVLILMAILILPMSSSYASTATDSLYVIERDAVQTRNFTPIVNHEILMINLGKDPLSLNVSSAIPAGKFVKGPFYPAFMTDSLLPDPMFSPLDVSPSKTSYLESPAVETSGSSTTLVWKDVTVNDGEAVIAQYDNYFGESSIYWTDDGLDILGLKIFTTYNIESTADQQILTFQYELENTKDSPIDDLVFDTFVPVQIFTETKEINLIELKEIAFSPNVTPSQLTRIDGLGRAASGVSATFWAETLPSKGKILLSLKLTGVKTQADDMLWPIITLRGRCVTNPVWPPAVIELDKPTNIGRFSYLFYNLVIPDSRKLKFSDHNVKILSADK